MTLLKHKFTKTVIAASLSAVIIGCDSDSNNTASTTPNTDATLNLTFTALDDLGDDFVYEGWILVDGSPVTTGRFTSNTSDTQSVSVEDIEAATKYILTIEPAVGDDPAPASTHVLAGDIINSSATLTIADGAALGTDFTNSTGSFIIAAPSATAEEFDQGIWWLMPPTPVAGLSLPVLPEGWAYEGWVAGPDGPVSTGTFTDVSAADSDGAGPTAGQNNTPNYPGQDFITPPLSLIGMAAVISVEPVPDNSPAPFGIKPLIDMDIENVGAGGSQDMANVIAENQPSGTLNIQLPTN